MTISQLDEKLVRFRKVLWPIEVCELKKFIPTALLMFCILFNYNTLRALKDSLVITSISAEATFFIKVWGVLPVAFLIMIFYAKLLNVFKEEKVFYIITGAFVAYFSLFHFYLYPNASFLHPNPESIQQLASAYPFVKYFIFIYGKWVYASFYIMSEMWGSAVLSLLFWQFANKTSTTEEAKRFYPMFIFLANFALIISGSVVKSFSLTTLSSVSERHMMDLVLVVIVIGLFSMALYRWMHLYVLTDPALYARAGTVKKSEKPRLSLKESFRLIVNSRYLGLIAILVVSYGFSINLLEGPWKAKIKVLYPNESEYAYFMGHFTFLKGVCSLAFLVIGSNVLRRCSWLTTALVAPIVFMVSGLLFYALCIFENDIQFYTYSMLGIEALALVVTMGTVQNVLCRCVTFSFFDSTKEIVYIPLDKELKTKGKAAVDIVGTRLGKSGSALIQSIGLTIFHSASLINSVPYLMAVYVLIGIMWIWAVINLNKEYLKQLALPAKKTDTSNEMPDEIDETSGLEGAKS